MTMKAYDIHYDIIQSDVDFLYMGLKLSMHNILRMVEQENDFKGFYNPKKDTVVECENISEFEKFQSLLKGLNNYVYYNSLILSSYSILEHSLRLICYFINEHFDLPKKFKEEQRDILGNCIDYIKSTQFVNFNEKEIDRIYMQIQNANKLRNLIAHFNGNLIRDNKHPLEKQQYYNLFKSDKRLKIIDNGQVYIDNCDYISSFVYNSEIFLKTIIEKIKNNC
jgi:hypothetical protein